MVCNLNFFISNIMTYITNNIKTDAQGNLRVNVTEPNTAFGEPIAQEPTPVAQVHCIYGINDQDFEQFTDIPCTLQMISEGTPSVSQVQHIYLPNADVFQSFGAGQYFVINNANNAISYYVWFNIDGGNTDPAITANPLPVNLTVGENSNTVANKVAIALNSVPASFSATVLLGNLLQVTNTANGLATSIIATGMPQIGDSSIASSDALIYVRNGSNSYSGVGQYAVIRSRRALHYRPGIGSSARFTALFDTPSVGNRQLAGIFNSVSGFFFGYDGTNFSIMRRTGGKLEVHRLQITNPASGPETGTIILDGVTFNVPLTAGNVQHNADEIERSDFKTAKYLTDHVNDTVIFMSEPTGPRNINTYSFSSSGTATGVFSTTTVGVVNNETFINQNDWNIDKMDGTGPSGLTLNPQNGNVFQIDYQWLGFGKITFSIEDPDNGLLIPVHRIQYANNNTTPSVTLPHFKVGWLSYSTVSSIPKTVKGASACLMIQGKSTRFDPKYSTSATATTVDASVTHLMTLRNPRVFNGIANVTEAFLAFLTVNNDANKPALIYFYINTILNNDNYQYVKQDQSTMLKTTQSSPILNGNIIFTTVVAANGSTTINLRDFEILLEANESITIAIQRTTTTNVTVTASLSWIEDH